MLVVDYYSRYVDVITLRGSTSSKSVIAALKTMFARHGIPDELRSDNGSQYHSDEFAQFASDGDSVEKSFKKQTLPDHTW